MRRSFAIVIVCLMAMWSQAAVAQCALPPGWAGVVTKRTHFIVFGETHGSAEPEAAVGAISCALIGRRERLLVALELSSTEDAGLQRAWALPHTKFANAVVREMPQWATRNDGNTSVAVLALLVRLHALRDAGGKIDVVAFNGERDDAQGRRFKDLPEGGAHEAAQAENIRNADTMRIHDRVLILVGSAHARKKPVAPRGVTYEPMAMRLAEPGRIATLYFATGAGGGWNCLLKATPPAGVPITVDMLDCGAHTDKGDVDWTGPPRIVDTRGVASAANPEAAYDATFFIGPITASPPAVAQP